MFLKIIKNIAGDIWNVGPLDFALEGYMNFRAAGECFAPFCPGGPPDFWNCRRVLRTICFLKIKNFKKNQSKTTWGTCLWQAKTSGVRSTLLTLETFFDLNFENVIYLFFIFCISSLWKVSPSTCVHHLYALHALRTLSNEIKWVVDHIFKNSMFDWKIAFSKIFNAISSEHCI